MDAIWLGLLCGLGFGLLDVLVMLPMKMENRRKKIEAVTSAFIERFMLGFLIPNVNLGIHPIMVGVLLGLTLSLPSAIITRAYTPIVGIGVAGGIIIGVIAHAVL
jgi:hypothetical protein